VADPFDLTISGIRVRAVVLDLTSASREAALRDALGALADAESIPAAIVDELHRGLLRREALGSTGIGQGVAGPHCRHVQIARPSVAICRLPHGVDWDALDGDPVLIAFLMLSNPGRVAEGLLLLEWISKTWTNGPRELLLAGAATEVRDALTKADPTANR
jgi:PTS system nitrogen regulatory IIA component